MKSSASYPFGSLLGPAATHPRLLPPSPDSFPPSTPPAASPSQRLKVIDWTAVAWAAVEFLLCGFFGLLGIGSATSLSALLLPGAAVALVVLLQKLSGVAFDLGRGTVRFYSFWLPQEVPLAEIHDANCELAMTLSPSRIVLAILAGNTNQSHGRELAHQRTFSVNLSGSFGSRQVRFSSKRWRDQFLSVLRDEAPQLPHHAMALATASPGHVRM